MDHLCRTAGLNSVIFLSHKIFLNFLASAHDPFRLVRCLLFVMASVVIFLQFELDQMELTFRLRKDSHYQIQVQQKKSFISTKTQISKQRENSQVPSLKLMDSLHRGYVLLFFFIHTSMLFNRYCC